MIEAKELRNEQLALLIGQVVGQLSQIMNDMAIKRLTYDEAYHCILDVTNAASLQIHELFYKGNKP